MINNLSLRASLALGIVLMGMLGIALATYVDVNYRRIALENQRLSIEEIIRLRVHDLLTELEKYSRDLGQAVQNNEQFRNDLRERNTIKVSHHLDLHFHQYFVTAGVLRLDSLIALDPQLNQIGISRGDAPIYENAGGVSCSSLKEKALARIGVERLKLISEMCRHKGYPFMHVLVPIGGLRLLGYLEVITDPTFSLIQIEEDIGMPMKIIATNGHTAYRSSQWPENELVSKGIFAKYMQKTGVGEDVFEVTVLRNVEAYEKQLDDKRNALLVTACLVTVFFAFLAIYLTKKSTLDPLQVLGQHLRKIRKSSANLEQLVEFKGNKEVRQLAHGFNEMIGDLKTLYDELQHTNSDLLAQIQEREKAEIELKLSRDHLEELVQKRTADLAVARDAAIRASQSKTQFLANMSHELRTPLNAIIGYTELLLEDAEDESPAFKNDLNKVHSAGQHLLVLIKDILDLTKIEAGKVDLDLQEYDVRELITDICDTAKPLVEKNDSHLIVSCPEDIGLMYADSTKLRQAVLNLLSNAAKFTNKGEVSIQVSVIVERDIEKIKIVVKDTGIGLTRLEMTKIFEAFMQADVSTTRKYGGTGLGLAISRNFCQMMGGDLTVTSEKGKGSVFTIIIPRIVKAFRAAERSAHAGFGDVIDPRAERTDTVMEDKGVERRKYISSVIIIDNDPVESEQATRFLKSKGYNAIAAFDTDTGAHLATRILPDVFFIDIDLLEKEEYQFVREVQRNKLLSRSAIVLIGDKHKAAQGYALGAIDCLQRPIEKPIMQAIINSCVRMQAGQAYERVGDVPKTG